MKLLISIVLASLSLVACTEPQTAADHAQPPPDETSEEHSGRSPVEVASEVVKGIGDPEIDISNVSETDFALDFNGPKSFHLDVPASEARSVKIPAGSYALRMTIDGIANEKALAFAADRRYTVKLYTVLELDHPSYVGKGFECFPAKSSVHYFLCTRRTDSCEMTRKQAPAEMVGGPCEHRAEMVHIRGKTKSGKPTAFFTETVAECEHVRKLVVHSGIATDLTACTPAK